KTSAKDDRLHDGHEEVVAKILDTVAVSITEERDLHPQISSPGYGSFPVLDEKVL
uniref:Uncharacterized protein n=1 Tax=Caenorhabditis japonica TaxID=281687 RepID=A0A8R1EY53_CAEJA